MRKGCAVLLIIFVVFDQTIGDDSSPETETESVNTVKQPTNDIDLENPADDRVPEYSWECCGGSCVAFNCSMVLEEPTTASPTIPDGKKKKFEVVIEKKFHWLEAYDYCKKNKRLLATVLSKEENDQVLELIKKLVNAGGHFWLAGTDIGHEGSWKWFSTKQPIQYADWLEGEPNNNYNNEHCLEYFDKFENGKYQWNDVDCSEEYNFICEYYE